MNSLKNIEMKCETAFRMRFNILFIAWFSNHPYFTARLSISSDIAMTFIFQRFFLLFLMRTKRFQAEIELRIAGAIHSL